MFSESSLGVVIPVYNEAEFITDVLDSIPEFVDTVVVIDDHSTDATWVKVLEYAHEQQATETETPSKQRVADGSGTVTPTIDSGTQQRILPVHHPSNRGRGAAVKTGYRIMLENDIDIVAVMDGDGQMEPDALPRLVEPIANGAADYAKGNRLENLDHCREMSRFRLFGNALLTVLMKIASGYWHVRDPQSGYTAISRSTLEELPLEDLYDRYGFLNDLLIHLGAYGYRVVDVPIEAIYEDESSGIRFHSFVVILSVLMLYRFIWRLQVSYGSQSQTDNRGVGR